MKKLHPSKNFTPEEITRVLSDVLDLITFFSDELKRQNPIEHKTVIATTEFDTNPIAQHNAFNWRGNSESFSIFYNKTVWNDIFLVESEEELKKMFSKMVPNEPIRIQEGRVSEVIYLFKGLSAPNVRVIALTNHLQQIMPLVFETKAGPVKYGTVKTRTSLDPCVASEERRKILDSIIEDVKWANRKM